MTNKEKEMLELLKQDPQISQSKIAQKLNISRSSASVHISNLIKKGHIAGRGYIFGPNRYVTVIGGANIDLICFANNKMIPKDSNPGKIKICSGGVGRNIAENLVKLGVDTRFITAIGDDSFSQTLRDECRGANIDISDAYVQTGGRTSTYIALMDKGGEMFVALSDMDIIDGLPVEHIRERAQKIKSSQIIVLDTNLPEEVLCYIASAFKGQELYLDGVSASKVMRAKDMLSCFHTIKLNLLEAQYLSGLTANAENGLETIGNFFLKKGVKRILITLGEKGVFLATKDLMKKYPVQKIKPVNATGAGDAFMAGLISASLQNDDTEFVVSFAIAASKLTLLSEETVNPFMSQEQVLSNMV